MIVVFGILLAIIIYYDRKKNGHLESSGPVGNIQFIEQFRPEENGSTCLQMIVQHHGKTIPIGHLNHIAGVSDGKVTFETLGDAALKLNLKVQLAEINFDTVREKAPLPFIASLDQGLTFVVVYKIEPFHVYAADPAVGKVKYDLTEFIGLWATDRDTETGKVLVFRPTLEFRGLQTSTLR